MAPLQTSNEQEALLRDILIPGRFDARDLKLVFLRTTNALNRAGLSYAVTGRVALALYCRAQCTDVIELQISAGKNDFGVAQLLDRKGAAARSLTSTVHLELSFAYSTAERAFLKCTPFIDWLGTHARMATPEHLLWLYLKSECVSAFPDAISLIQSRHIDLTEFGSFAETDPKISRRFAIAKWVSQRAEKSTYCASVERRLSRLPRQLPVWRMNR